MVINVRKTNEWIEKLQLCKANEEKVADLWVQILDVIGQDEADNEIGYE